MFEKRPLTKSVIYEDGFIRDSILLYIILYGKRTGCSRFSRLNERRKTIWFSNHAGEFIAYDAQSNLHLNAMRSNRTAFTVFTQDTA